MRSIAAVFLALDARLSTLDLPGAHSPSVPSNSEASISLAGFEGAALVRRLPSTSVPGDLAPPNVLHAAASGL
jgi:hypothetical protein